MGFFDKHASEISEACKVTGDFLRELRESYGLSQKQFASILGVSTVTIGNWERNCHEPDYFYQKKLRDVKENPEKLTEKVPQRKCAICGKVLPPKAKKYCSDECRRKGEAKWCEQYREKVREQKVKEMARVQLTLFDVSDLPVRCTQTGYSTSEQGRGGTEKRNRKSVGTEKGSRQLRLW